jgi:HPt (histidine-containing phosphotransfer) domain-containing protein
MVDAFSEQCDEKLGVIGQALEEGDMEKAEDEAHSLKGASRLLGAEALGELARTMEDSAREGRKDEARGAFDRAMREANTALKAMKDFTDQLE